MNGSQLNNAAATRPNVGAGGAAASAVEVCRPAGMLEVLAVARDACAGVLPAVVAFQRSCMRLSRGGSLQAELEVTDDMMPGVVSLPHGYGHGRAGVKTTVANNHPGVSCNTITEADYLDELSGNAALNGVQVTITAT